MNKIISHFISLPAPKAAKRMAKIDTNIPWTVTPYSLTKTAPQINMTEYTTNIAN